MAAYPPFAAPAAAWSPPDRRPIYDWAHDHVELPPSLTIRGKFDVTRSRHLIAPFDSLASDYVRETSVLAPVRGGKSLIADIWLTWIIINDPGPTIWNFQKDQTADDHCETRLWPLLRQCHPIAELLRAVGRHQKRTSEIIFPHMFVIVQGPALSNLQSKGCRYLINDEVWQYPAGRMAEAYGRVGDFVRMNISKILNLSQAAEPESDWSAIWELSTQHLWRVPCDSCAEPMPLHWSERRADQSRAGMRWDEHRLRNHDWDIPRCLPTLRYECPACGHPHIDSAALKSRWNRLGSYEPANPHAQPHRQGFRWSSIIDYPWTELAEEFLHAANARRRGTLMPMIQFFQKRMAEFMGESRLLEQTAALPTASYDVRSDWPDEFARFFAVDRQQEDTYWGTIRAWSKDGESRRLWFGQLLGSAAIEEKRIEFDVPPNRTFVDSGHEAKGDFGVYALCAKYGWVAVKGSGYRSFVNRRNVNGRKTLVHCTYKDPHPVSPSTGDKRQCYLILYSADEMKDRVRNLIKLGQWKEPDETQTPELEKEYAEQMSSEYKRPKTNKFTGRTEMVWVCPSGNNHAFDCAGMQCLGATILKILPDIETYGK